MTWYAPAPGAPGAPHSRLMDRASLEGAARAEGVDWQAQVHRPMLRALRELLAGAGALRIGGGRPDSRALYGVDILPAWRQQEAPPHEALGAAGRTGAAARYIQPLVLEVNFQGDLDTLLERVPAAGGAAAPSFVFDVLSYLYADAPLPEGWEALDGEGEDV